MNLEEFKTALQEFSIELTHLQLDQLHTYFEMLVEYNKVMNLTGITEEEEVYLKHFYDSLTLARVCSFYEVKTLCDVGTGAGFPGMVLKIVFPSLEVTLVDSLHKRIDFLNLVIEKLQLQKVYTVAARIEEYAKTNREQFEVVTARAVAPLSMLLEYSIPLVQVGGYFLPMKGTMKEEEKNTKALSYLHAKIEKIDTFYLPKENSMRTIYVIKKEAKTEKKYPRRFSEMKNRPL